MRLVELIAFYGSISTEASPITGNQVHSCHFQWAIWSDRNQRAGEMSMVTERLMWGIHPKCAYGWGRQGRSEEHSWEDGLAQGLFLGRSVYPDHLSPAFLLQPWTVALLNPFSMVESKIQKILYSVPSLATLVRGHIIAWNMKGAVRFLWLKKRERKSESVGGWIVQSFWVGESLERMREMGWALLILFV